MNCTQRHGLLSARDAVAAIVPLTAVMLMAPTPAAAFALAAATNLPSCLPPPETNIGIVSRVDDRGVVILRDGRVVKPEALLLPAGQKDNAPQMYRRDALATLRKVLRSRHVTLHVGGPRLDRYRRLRAQVVVEGRSGQRTWLQREMLSLGLARVFIAPDRHECARELYAVEDQARQGRVGLWSASAYAVRAPESLDWRDLGTFQIVQGEVVGAAVRGSRAYLNFGQNWRRDFTATIAPDDIKTFRAEGVDPQSYAGKTIRVRGWVDRLNGFEIEASSPEQLEIVSDTD